ncbi:MAG: hypothetical protein ACI9QL_003270 [Candidatus Omnitrophota bacterium]|jgi:hypothetical protein
MLNEIACLHIYSVLNGVFDDPARNVYEVTEEWAFHNGHYGTREDVVFLINGIPVLVIECKNARKDEAIALGVDQIRRYHRETPELFVSQQLFTATDAIGFSYGVSWNTVRRNIFNWKWDRHSCLSLPKKDRQECLSHLGKLGVHKLGVHRVNIGTPPYIEHSRSFLSPPDQLGGLRYPRN